MKSTPNAILLKGWQAISCWSYSYYFQVVLFISNINSICVCAPWLVYFYNYRKEYTHESFYFLNKLWTPWRANIILLKIRIVKYVTTLKIKRKATITWKRRGKKPLFIHAMGTLLFRRRLSKKQRESCMHRHIDQKENLGPDPATANHYITSHWFQWGLTTNVVWIQISSSIVSMGQTQQNCSKTL